MDLRECRFLNYEALFTGNLPYASTQWSFYKSSEGHLPSTKELESLKGIIIPGSFQSANDDLPWMLELQKFLGYLAMEHKNIKILGGCFGHQIIAKAFGGRVGKVSKDKLQGFATFIGIDEIELNESFYELSYVKKALLASPENDLKYLRLLKSHNDAVVELPESAVVHGTSDRTSAEIYTIGTQVLCMQGHPEMNAHYMAQ